MKKQVSRKKKHVRLAIVGAGGMARTHATNFQAIAGCEVVAVAEIDPVRRAEFCRTFGIVTGFETTGELLSNIECDAVSIVTPDALHAPLSIQCLEAGKHVICEKPLALDHAEAARMVAAARSAGVRNMVNFSYRNWRCIHAVAALVRRGDLGEVRHVEASYLQSWLVNKAWGDWRTSPNWLWRLSQRHGSRGVLGDIGVHIVDFATYPAGPIIRVFAQLKTFKKAPRNRIGKYNLDANDSAVMQVEFAGGALGVIHTTRWAAGHINRLALKIHGTEGAVAIDSERSTTSFLHCGKRHLDQPRWREVKAAAVPTNYERFIASIRGGADIQPDFARGAEVQRMLDACFESHATNRPVQLRH